MEFRRIRDLREDSDRTQQEVADYLVMHTNVYRRYELGQREIPRLRTSRALPKLPSRSS